MKSIKTKIFLSILICCIFITTIMGYISIHYVKSISENNSKETLTLLCTNKDEEFENTISKIEQSVNTLADISSDELTDLSQFKSNAEYVKAYQDKLEPIAKKFGDNTAGAMTFYIRFNPQYTEPTSGIFFSRTDKNLPFEKLIPTDFSKYDENDTEHVGWYYLPIKQNKAIWIDPYLNSNVNLYMVSYVVPLIKDGETIGVVGMDLDFSEISNVVTNTTVYDTGYAFLLTGDNKIVSHPTLEVNDYLGNIDNSNINSLINDVNPGKISSYTYNGTEKLMSYCETSNNWKFVVTVPRSEILQQSKTLTQKIIIAIFISIILAIVISLIVGTIIANPIQKITKIIEKASNLDLTTNEENDYLLKYKDEIGSLSRAYEKMRKEFETLIRKISNVSNILNSQSTNLNDIVLLFTTDISNIQTAIKTITNDVQETSASSAEISASINEIDTSVDVLSSKALESSNNANDSKLHATSAKEKSDIYKVDVKNLYSNAKESTLKSIKNSEIVNEINILADTISEIAEQTNLIALNAAIESAKAGDAGKSFAIVSDEIRILAEQSSIAVNNIKNTITQVQDSFKDLSENSMNILDFMNKNIESQTSMVNDLCIQYTNDSKFVSNLSDEIASMSEQLSATVTEVNEAIKITADNALKSSESVELIETSIDKTSKSIQTISETAKSQKESSSEIYSIINKFKIDNN